MKAGDYRIAPAFMGVLAILSFSPLVGQSHIAPASPRDSAAQEPAARKKALSLAHVTRVSTDEAARQAAKERKQEQKSSSAESTESGILEFHPASQPGSSKRGDLLASPKGSKQSPLKDIHGTAYGSTALGESGDRRMGAAVGASSWSRKTSIYVETDRSRVSTPSPR